MVAFKLKVVTDDDVLLVFRSIEKKTLTFFTTNVDFKYDQPTTPFSAIANSTVQSDEPQPSCFEVAKISPSKIVAKPTARSMKLDKEKFCRKC